MFTAFTLLWTRTWIYYLFYFDQQQKKKTSPNPGTTLILQQVKMLCTRHNCISITFLITRTLSLISFLQMFFFIITFFYWAVPQFLKLACGYKMQRLICASSYHRLCGRQRSENAVFKPSLRPSVWHFPVSPSLISCPVSLHRLWVTGHIRQADRSTAANDNILLKASESKWMFLLFSVCVFTRNLTLTLDFLQPSACSVDVCRDACIFIPFKYLSSRKSLPEMKEKMMMTS